jgi:hypothetical protein
MSEQIMRENLTALAKKFAKARGLSLSTISKKIHGKSDFFEEYSAGRQTTRINHYWLMVNRLRMLWPPGVEWPKTKPIEELGKTVDKGFPNAP